MRSTLNGKRNVHIDGMGFTYFIRKYSRDENLFVTIQSYFFAFLVFFAFLPPDLLCFSFSVIIFSVVSL